MAREIDKVKIAVVFTVSTLLFCSGFLLSDFLTNKKINYIDSSLSDITLQTASLETEYTLLLENACNSAGFDRLTSSLDELGRKLVFTDEEKANSGDKTENTKSNYFLLEVKHLLFTNRINKECSKNYTTILYFYSDKGDCDMCKVQGFVLTNLKEINPDAMIYSFDINSESSLVKTLKDIYKVSTVPSIVIDNKVYEGLNDQNTLLAILNFKR